MRVQKPTSATRRGLVSKSASTALVAALRTSIVVASLSMASTSAFAGSKLFTFDDDSTADLIIFSNTTDPVRAEGGQSGGYLAITDAINDRFSTIIFPDIDGGKPVAGFTLECDVRLGNPVGNDGRPADGLAVSYARANDPLLINGEANKDNPAYDIRSSFSVGGAPEMGTRTGIVVSFDTWQGNAYLDGTVDVEGLMVQVDGKVVKTYAMGTRNGACDDITSLETGPYDSTASGSPDGLCWTKLKVDLAVDGKLTVGYKGATILDKFQTAFFPSPGRIVFSGRTGGANANQHVDNVSLITIPAENMLGAGSIDNAFSWRAIITDNVATGSILDPATAVFSLDGVAVTPTSVEKIDNDTFFRFTRPISAPFASGSTHSVKLTAKDTKGVTLDVLRDLVTPSYTLVPGSLASGIDETSAELGFKYRVQWSQALNRGLGNTDVNRTFFAERQINQAYLDASGAPVPNEATLDGADENGYLNIDGAVNYDQQGASQGNFTTATGKPEGIYPGMPSADNNSFTVEFSGYALLEPGAYRFAVNSDDGFKHTVGRGLSDAFGLKLGEFDGGRGASDTAYDVVVLERGLYPMRWLQWEGGGGANVEIFTINNDGSRHLVNDPDDEASIKVYRTGLAKSHVRLTSPVPDQIGGAAAESPITIEVVDGKTAVGPITVKIDGILQSTPVTKAGNVSTFHMEFPNGQDPGDHVVQVAFDDVVQTYRYNVASLPIARGDANFAIEAEDFNNNGAKVGDAVNVMPYLGGAGDTQPAILNVDFFDNDGDDSNVYRTEDPQDVNITQQGVVNNLNMANRGSWVMSANYRIGWIGDNNWYNYTRTVPAGDYTVYAALSIDNVNAGSVGGRLALVDGDNCASGPLGTFNGYGSSAWGLNNLIALADDSGNRVVYHSDGTEKTFRYFARSGDFDYVAFVPLSGVAFSATPASVVGANGPLTFTLVGSVDKASPTLTVDGSAMALTSTVLPNGVTVSAAPATAIGAAGSSHTYVLSFKDAAGTSYSKSGSFKISDGTFVIEAEDYNFGRGQTLPGLSNMPYFGGGMSAICEAAVQGIDISNRDGFDSDVYRKEVNLDGTAANVNINANIDGARGQDNDINRGPWDVTTNYKIGWIGGGDWHNYTRTIPAGNYEVWAALSFDSNNDHDLRGSLQRVTAGQDTEVQELEQLGTFDDKGTASFGGWGANRLVQLKKDGEAAIVTLPGGTVTLRASIDSGDFDYFKLVPSTATPRPVITSIVKNADGSITITWTGGGSLEAALSLDGPWQTVPGATSPFTFSPGAPAQFGRIRR